MKRFFNKLQKDVFPAIDAETIFEIDNSNLRNIFNVSAIVLVLQTVALSVFAIINHSRLGDPQVLSSIFNVGVSIPLFMLVMFISGRIRRSENYVRSHHRGVVTFVTVFAAIFLIWGMFASTNSIIRGEQILTFFTVQLCVVLFVRLRPIVSTILLLATYVGFFLFLELFFRHGMLNPYNYMMHVVLSIAGAIVNYHLTVSNIAKKNQIRKLNESLSQIANHDSLTRLKNRHALNEDIPDYLGGEVCVCMMDINKFKSINDTFGHQKGDEVLCHVSEVLLGNFPDKYIYRYGGDEFLVIYPEATTDTIDNTMRNVNERLARYRLDLSDNRLGCAYGCVSGSVTSQGELIALIASADAALYQQKKNTLYQQSSYS